MSRDDYPLFTGLLAYFPRALSEVARCSKVGNDQHNPGEPLHWARHKSTAHADKILRHLRDSLFEPLDDDGVLHVVKVAWRALALAEEALDASRVQIVDRKWTAEEIAILDGFPATGGGESSQTMLSAGEFDRELTPEQAALIELGDEDAPIASLKAGEALP